MARGPSVTVLSRDWVYRPKGSAVIGNAKDILSVAHAALGVKPAIRDRTSQQTLAVTMLATPATTMTTKHPTLRPTATQYRE